MCVVGAGLAGLTIASLLPPDLGVRVYDYRGTIGVPQHCAGIVSWETMLFYRKLVGERAVEKGYKRITIHTPRGSIEVSFRRPWIYRLDRLFIEKELYRRALSRGTVFHLGTRINTVAPEDNGLFKLSTCRGEVILCRDVVLADGGINSPSTMLTGPPREIINGIQYIARAREEGEPGIHVIFTKETPYFIIWVVPLGNNRYMVGYGYRIPGKPLSPLKLYGIVEKRIGIRFSPGFEKVFGGLIPLGPPSKPVPLGTGRGAVYLYGDALHCLKPVSGGGIYSIARLAQPLARSIINGDPGLYKLYAGALCRRVKIQYLARSIALKLGGLYTLASTVYELTRYGIRIKPEDYDRHEKIALRSLPILATLAPLILPRITRATASSRGRRGTL